MDEHVPVLIVGGGMVGLSAAVFAASQGIDCQLVERRSTTSSQPRSRGLNPRTMELMRSVGLEEAIRQAPSARALLDNSGMIAMESLAGREVGALQDNWVTDVHTDLSALTPTSWCLCHQADLEPLLLERAGKLGADLRFGHELIHVEQDDDGVTATIRAADRQRTVRADYLIAADGPHSSVRTALGIDWDSSEVHGNYLNIHFRADLREALGDRRFVMAYTFRPFRSGLMPLDNALEWLLHVVFEPAETFDEARCVELVRAVAGIPELDVELLGAAPWQAVGRTATSFRQGRIFLAGDSAHTMPPSGAFGANTGLQDAYNLVWKLGSVLRGEAGPSLLDTYDAERRPVAEATVRQAILRSNDRPRMTGQNPAPPNPEIVPDTEIWFGDRAPHLPLSRSGTEISTLDLFGSGYVLLAGPDGEKWLAAAKTVTAYRIGAPGLIDISGRWQEAYEVGASGAVLVRPDGVIAWRATTLPPDPELALTTALAH
ncbi:MAG TPA: FAD-dependent monooxygenase [Pseudonocardiaceae bacterium]|nr:FAD-dependent monooxygenase [Pseudonocardiaceae bacterium]